MTPEDLQRTMEKLGSEAIHQIDEENTVAIEAMKSVVEHIDINTRVDWLYNKEWEDALVPIRLPKGMVELFEQLDNSRVETIGLPHCKECRKRDDCLLIKRKISEIAITNALKIAITRVDIALEKSR